MLKLLAPAAIGKEPPTVTFPMVTVKTALAAFFKGEVREIVKGLFGSPSTMVPSGARPTRVGSGALVAPLIICPTIEAAPGTETTGAGAGALGAGAAAGAGAGAVPPAAVLMSRLSGVGPPAILPSALGSGFIPTSSFLPATSSFFATTSSFLAGASAFGSSFFGGASATTLGAPTSTSPSDFTATTSMPRDSIFPSDTLFC